MKTTCFKLLLVLLFLEEAASAHLETCECHEIKSIVNASIEHAIARLKDKMTLEINETHLISTMERLLKPIQQQLNYHLPPPPPSPPPPPPLWKTNSEDNPAESCKAIYDDDDTAPSGYYLITNSTGHPVRVYCKMNATCGNMTGGWMIISI